MSLDGRPAVLAPASAHGFDRTVCGCAACVACCTRQPGSLAPGDFERITDALGAPADGVSGLFWASPGALVGDSVTGRTWRIGTITPQFRAGRCVFLGPDDRCGIHAVAPFGCAFFDTHMNAWTAQKRSTWLLHAISASPAYATLRATLPAATHHAPSRY